MRRVPLLPVALAVMAGIVVARLVQPSLPMALWLMAMAAVATAVGVLFVRHTAWPAMLCALVFSFGLGTTLMSLQQQNDWVRSCPTHTYLTVKVKESPQPRERSWRCAVEVERVGDRPVTGRAMLFLRRDSLASALRYGDKLLLHVYPDTVRRMVYATSDHYIITEHDSTSLRSRSERLRMRLLRRVQQGPLPAEQAAIAEAMVLGWRANLPQGMVDAFRDAGIAHLLAVSGLHVGLLAAVVGWLMIWIGRERKGRVARGAVQLFAVWTFALLSGMAPSTMRAALMFSLFIVSDITARRTPKMNILAAAALLTLVVNPMLLFDVGWQLSYCAVAGILLARPVINAFRNRIWQASAVSVSATLATLPVVVATFHRLPVYFLIANVVIVPLAGVLLVLSLLYVAVPITFFAWPLGAVARAINAFTAWVASLPGAVVDGIHLSPVQLAVCSAVVLFLLLSSYWIGQRKAGQTGLK